MADDKGGGGGGSAWGPFEIILIVILGIALLDTLTGRKTVLFPNDSPSKKVSVTKPVVDATKNGCGLTIITPKMNASVGASISIVGSVAGCNWNATETTALYAQVIDADGIPVSKYEAIKPSTTKKDGTVSFATTIELTTTPATSKGTIIFLPAVPVPDRAVTIRMPLTFTAR